MHEEERMSSLRRRIPIPPPTSGDPDDVQLDLFSGPGRELRQPRQTRHFRYQESPSPPPARLDNDYSIRNGNASRQCLKRHIFLSTFGVVR